METKSRYEILSELEQTKRILIVQRDELDNDVADKESRIRYIEDEISRLDDKKNEFAINEKAELDRLDAKRKHFLLEIENNRKTLTRQLSECKIELDKFKANIDKKKETKNELIKSVESSLEKFNFNSSDKS